ncbi:MAG: hypothetical protein MJ002_03495 [Paludibacteraceae bacterium]|nr:hypothetical protein [Paludibacteraceae bacterium]
MNIKVGVTLFIQQMMKWYPEVFLKTTFEYEHESLVKRLVASISAEKSKWMKDDNEVPIKDMPISCANLGLAYDCKLQSLFFVGNEPKKELDKIKVADTRNG